jgi:hypothetical protein
MADHPNHSGSLLTRLNAAKIAASIASQFARTNQQPEWSNLHPRANIVRAWRRPGYGVRAEWILRLPTVSDAIPRQENADAPLAG